MDTNVVDLAEIISLLRCGNSFGLELITAGGIQNKQSDLNEMSSTKDVLPKQVMQFQYQQNDKHEANGAQFLYSNSIYFFEQFTFL